MLERGMPAGVSPHPCPRKGTRARAWVPGWQEQQRSELCGPLINDHRVARESTLPETHRAMVGKAEMAGPAVLLK